MLSTRCSPCQEPGKRFFNHESEDKMSIFEVINSSAKVQIVVGKCLLDNLRKMAEDLSEGKKSQLRGPEREALIEAYSDAIATAQLRSDLQVELFWAKVNALIREKFGLGTLKKVKEGAWAIFEARSAQNCYCVGES